MSNLNLSIDEAGISQEKSRIFGGALVLPFLILILVLALYGGIIYFDKKVSSEIQDVEARYKSEYANFLASDSGEILDFENRKDVAENIISGNASIVDVLAEIEKVMLTSVYLDSFEYDKSKKTIILDCVGDNFNVVAKQILSFKKSDYFSLVEPGQSLIDSKSSKLNFIINLKIK